MKKLKSNLLIYPLLLVIFSIWLISDTIAGSHLDWGGDYAGYLLQAKSYSNGNVQELSDSLKKIVQLTDGKKYTFAQTPAPWGYPIFISAFDFFHEWDIVKLKYLNLLAGRGGGGGSSWLGQSNVQYKMPDASFRNTYRKSIGGGGTSGPAQM